MNTLRSLLGQVVEISLAMGAVTALLLVLRRLLNKRYRAKAWYWVWLLAALRLAVPLHLALPQAPVHITVPDPAIVYSQTVPARAPEAGQDQVATLPQGQEKMSAPAQGGAASPAGREGIPYRAEGKETAPPPPAAYAPSLTLGQLAGMVWAAGAAVFLGWNLLSYARFRRWTARRRREAEDEKIAAHFDALAKELGVKNLALGLCPGLPSPLVMGFFRPILLLPREDYAPEELDAILRHELIHAKRHDLWYKLLLLWARCVHWFDPLVHLMARRAERDLELSCDEAVVAGRDGAFHARYGHAVLSAAQRGLARPAAPLTSQFRGGKKALKERIGAIADRAVRRRGTVVVCVAAVAVAIAAGACSVTREPASLDTPAPSASPAPSEPPTPSEPPVSAASSVPAEGDFPEIPLEEYDLSIPVPEFLTAEQQLLYRQAFAVYRHLFGAETSGVEDWARADGARPGEYETFQDGNYAWTISRGRYADWEDFEAMVHSIFTVDFFHNRNRTSWHMVESGDIQELLRFREHGGKMAFLDASRGCGYWRNDNFPDTFELIELTDELIRFYLVGYYSYCYPLDDEPMVVNKGYPARDMRLEAGYEYTDRWELRMVRTEEGWRFDSFFNTSIDEHDYHGIHLEDGLERYTLNLSSVALSAEDPRPLRKDPVLGRFDPVMKEGKPFMGGFAPNGEPSWLAHEMTLTSAREEFFSHMSERADVESYALCDMDGDGEQELILRFDDPAGTYLALHREGEKFYGVFYYIRWLEELQQNGIYVGSGGAAIHYYHRLRFEDGQAVEELLAEDVQGQCRIAGEEVTQGAFADWVAEHMVGDAFWHTVA